MYENWLVYPCFILSINGVASPSPPLKFLKSVFSGKVDHSKSTFWTTISQWNKKIGNLFFCFHENFCTKSPSAEKDHAATALNMVIERVDKRGMFDLLNVSCWLMLKIKIPSKICCKIFPTHSRVSQLDDKCWRILNLCCILFNTFFGERGN